MKMSEQFDFRNWITQNSVGPYSKMSSNKRLINENIKTTPGSGKISATIDVNDPDYLEKLAYGTNISVMPSGNYPSEYIITGPQDSIMQLLSDLGYEEGDYELSEGTEGTDVYEEQTEADNYDRAWGLVGNSLKDVIDTLRDDGYEDEDIMDIMRTALEMYDQVFESDSLNENSEVSDYNITDVEDIFEKATVVFNNEIAEYGAYGNSIPMEVIENWTEDLISNIKDNASPGGPGRDTPKSGPTSDFAAAQASAKRFKG